VRVGGPGEIGRRSVGSDAAIRKRQAFEAVRHLESSVAGSSAFAGIVLRYGAIERRAPGVYNIVDDDSAPVRDWLPTPGEDARHQAAAHVPRWLAQILVGEHLVMMMTESQAGSNLKARRELGWQPGRPWWRWGFAAVLGASHDA
jgi:hypothetical protein